MTPMSQSACGPIRLRRWSVDTPARSRFLVIHDYGTGANWWWVIAIDEDEILETFANVEVLTDAEHLTMVADWALSEVDVTGPHPPGLDGLAAKRSEQRGQSGYGVLASRARPIHLRWNEASTGVTWYTEFNPAGRRTRQVRISADGVSQAFTEWTIDVPEDLRDPALVSLEITAAEFEAAWAACT
jgi:hypothetical protein